MLIFKWKRGRDKPNDSLFGDRESDYRDASTGSKSILKAAWDAGLVLKKSFIVRGLKLRLFYLFL